MGYKRSKQDKDRLIRLYKKTHRKYRGAWYDDDSKRYYKISFNKNGRYSRASFLRKVSNRKVRRNKLSENVTGYNYKKFYDYWWELL